MLGLYYLGMPTLCHETGSPLKGALKALQKLREAQFAYYDVPSEHVYVPNMAREQIGDRLQRKDNRHIAVLKELRQLKNTPFYSDFVVKYREAFELQDLEIPPNYVSPLQAPSEPLRSQEQDQEQEQEQKIRLRGKRAFDPNSVLGLNLEAWEIWVAYRAERKPAIKAVSMQAAAEELAAFGTEQLAVVQKSKAAGYQGLFAPKANGSGKHLQQALNHDAAWAEAKARAQAIGFRDPFAQESAAVYMTQVKQAETMPASRRAPDVSALADKMRIAK